jgi:uracil-DNA glycosylase
MQLGHDLYASLFFSSRAIRGCHSTATRTPAKEARESSPCPRHQITSSQRHAVMLIGESSAKNFGRLATLYLYEELPILWCQGNAGACEDVLGCDDWLEVSRLRYAG